MMEADRAPKWNEGTGAFIVGLDFGRSFDYSALTVVERFVRATGREFKHTRRVSSIWYDRSEEEVTEVIPETFNEYHVVHANRWPLGTRYQEVVRDVALLMDRPIFRHRSALRYDATGLGAPVGEMIEDVRRRNLYGTQARTFGRYFPEGITITGGREAKGLHVPKMVLVSEVEILLQDGRLKIPPTIPFSTELQEELKAFKRRITDAGNITAGAEGNDHDDLVLSLALAVHSPRGPGTPRFIDPDGHVDSLESPGYYYPTATY